ncbi:PTS system, cellobiose-specific IIA component [Cetobacterium ceti]|uniref:PTS system, cellobiose-specific IIA component n=1 Tax=Cetobacterium ceti TaxID=180163 RepID=A0A1T4LE48_9FUSO|nr:PTS lactose/cellobiose transporter subunit IIA [Cetobacterium ceti]SJZ52891.1 PTS system, cellobiose-specific IIA component [Cetobacterium ceti]
MDIEEIAMGIVGNAGESRGLSYEALKEAKKGNFEKAEEILEEAKKKMYEAHKIQTELICDEADGKPMKINLLMIHAQDHLMNSILARELVEELIDLHREVKELKGVK